MSNSMQTIKKKRSTSFKPAKDIPLMAIIKGLIIAGFVLALLPGCSRDKDITTKSPRAYIMESENLVIPAAIEVPANLPGGNKRVATYYATGVQKYKAQVKAGGNGSEFEWVFVAPQADLFDITNNKIGTHSAGPSWQLLHSTTDSIFAQAYTPARNAPSPGGGSIDWLLLKPKTGKTPTGIFSQVNYIQRIATTGGRAPVNAPTNAAQTTDVPYTAIYRFTQQNP